MTVNLKEKIREVKDFPKPGIGFKDITPLLKDADAFRSAVNQMTAWAEKLKPELIIGIESRGFLFAAPMAHQIGVGMSLIRKKGKLPYQTKCLKAPNEYAVEYFEMHIDALESGQRVIIIDDLIATGSSSICSIDLINSLGGRAVGFGAVIDLGFLKGTDAIRKAHPETELFTLITFEE